MRQRTLSTATALAVLFGSAALAAGTAGTAAADSAKLLPATSVGGMVVDGSHQRVYLSDPADGKLLVTDYSGTVQASLPGLPGVTGLALSADSATLYAAVKGAHEIVAVDTSTYRSTASYPVDGADPTALERLGDRLWFGYAGGLGSLDLSGDQPVVALDVDGGALGEHPLLAADPAAPNVLAAESDSALTVFDVTADGVTVRARANVASNVKQIDLTPDGQEVLTSWDDGASYGYAIGAFSTADLSRAGDYPTAAYPNAVTVAPDGEVAAGSFSWYDPDVHVFAPGAASPTREYDFPNTGSSSGADTLVDGALAWAPDHSRLFAVSENDAGVLTLRTLGDPEKEVPALKVSAPATATRAKKLTVQGTLTSKTAVPAGTVLTVTRTDLSSPKGKALASVRTGAGGAFTFADTPPAGGKVTYKVAYAGDATHVAASASASVQVSRSAVALSLNHNKGVYGYGTHLTFTAHLGTTYTNRTVELWADPAGSDKPNKLLKKGTVSKSGNLSVALTLTRNTTVSAVFAGDAHSAPKTVKSTAYARVKVSLAVSKQYRKAKIGSTTYYWFHKKTDPVLTTTMTYAKGREEQLALQVYYDGKWYDSDAEYFKLGTSGKVAVRLGAPGVSGIRARVRASYVKGTSGDSLNTTTHGSWVYLYFTK
ncbi:hypothetical protein [Actinacidiphila guanduensis]|uniref:Ig-like domain repeat protein n=1 Tax=Actinacidiphila guanduensis TaxID=310781 RepID=A0A1H0P5B6_9ACTN|nr:hypothetical protein [Actinacidiphila guanduensis]SDP00287.1 hypothetical protein SAMN05216259_11572 [Actinacidiphila guanduensis]